jgi:hypothetical protein
MLSCGDAQPAIGHLDDGASSDAPRAAAPALDAGRKAAARRMDAATSADSTRDGNERTSTAEPSSPVWVDAGGDAGSPQAADDGLKCYPMLAHNGDFQTPYALGIAKDAYTAFTFAAPWKETEYAVLFRPVIDNQKVIHHWLLFQDNEPATPGPGVVENGTHPNSTMMAAWLPGTEALDLRVGEIGLELPATTTYTLEIHYNSSDASAHDRSGVEVCTAPIKPKHIASYTWLGYEQLGVPAQEWTGVCKPQATEPIHIFSIVPHMHLTGTHLKATINRKEGSSEVFHDADFDFSYQRMYQVDLTLMPGDTITTHCTYSEPKSYGPGVHDEMCYIFTVAYPKGALSSADLVGGVLHGAGTTCLGQ